MATRHLRDLWRYLRHGVSLLGIVSLSVLSTLAVQHWLTPPRAIAQPAQPQEARASAFVLVGPDGTVLGRLQVGPAGNGQLVLLDEAGRTRTVLTGNGSMVVVDADGTTVRFESGYRLTAGAMGVPPVNGVLIDPTGAVDYLPASP